MLTNIYTMQLQIWQIRQHMQCSRVVYNISSLLIVEHFVKKLKPLAAFAQQNKLSHWRV